MCHCRIQDRSSEEVCAALLAHATYSLFQRLHSSIIRQVKPNEGEDLAKVNKAAWVETSAKNDVNVGKCNSGSYDLPVPISHPVSYFKARYLSYAWPKSKSGRPPAVAKHQQRTNVSLCDTICPYMHLLRHRHFPLYNHRLSAQPELHRPFTSYLPLLLLLCSRAGRIDVLSPYFFSDS